MNEFVATFLLMKRKKIIAWLIQHTGVSPETVAQVVDGIIEGIEEAHF